MNRAAKSAAIAEVAEQPEAQNFELRVRRLVGYAELSTLRSMVCRGALPHLRISGKIVRFDVVEIERWLASKATQIGGAP
ncbi:MAG: helix-turn-helix domain-containing protein [Deltaproteobacteria bacterium]|nr:helix-turn-helix domain-containing protein [Deltaproteobacteria bacterium]